MSDADTNATTPRTASDAPVNPAPPAGIPTAAEEWKPEARQWTWKDLFTAPMLAFKPKCMLISALTLVIIAVWMGLLPHLMASLDLQSSWLRTMVDWLWSTAALVIFSLGATLVGIFLKADLLDDEFLSFKEALQQFKTRLIPAILVPLFLRGLCGCVYLALVWIPNLCFHIPYFGTACHAIFYPLVYLGSLFAVLLGIAIWLSVFVFPSIIAIRKHGWFDNVVDTIEAVGTKPHVLVGSMALTVIMVFFAYRISMEGIYQIRGEYEVMPEAVGTSVQTTEFHAKNFGAQDLIGKFDELILNRVDDRNWRSAFFRDGITSGDITPPPSYYSDTKYYKFVTGPITGVWQTIIEAAILGYILNLFVSGGMLTYLVVREDDYWDDENLEDLDQLAKELEEEAKRDQGANQTPSASGTATGQASAASPVPVPPAPTPGAATPAAVQGSKVEPGSTPSP